MRFIGNVEARWLRHDGEDREMQLLADFSFIDSRNVVWTAPAGSIINGASIPRQLWSRVGSPFVGDYRRASVVHDVHCALKEKPHREVHRMFYDAMICDGVAPFKARYMYQAVRLLGPKWGNGRIQPAPDVSTGEASAIWSRNADLDINELEQELDALLDE